MLENFPFRYTSDCRGHSIFRPMVDGLNLCHPQVPTTLPTYVTNSSAGKCTAERLNACLFEMIRPGCLNVLTIHAEVEGISCLPLFCDFLNKTARRGIVIEPLGDILSSTQQVEKSGVHKSVVNGREGWLTFQDNAAAITKSMGGFEDES